MKSHKRVKNRRNRLPPKASSENDDDDDDDDEYNENDDDDAEKDDDDDGDGMDYAGAFQSMSGIFEGVMSSVSQYMPSMPYLKNFQSFGFSDDTDDKVRHQRSTTPRGDLRKPKKPMIQFYEDDYVTNDADDKLNRWYNPFMLMADDVTTTTEAPSTTASSLFNWLGGGVSKESVEETTTENSSKYICTFLINRLEFRAPGFCF